MRGPAHAEKEVDGTPMMLLKQDRGVQHLPGAVASEDAGNELYSMAFCHLISTGLVA